MDAREGGFIVLHRRVRSSAIWQAMNAEQRSVFVTILLLANWKPCRAIWRNQWYEVRRGEFSFTLANIAKEAATSVKVVRNTLTILMADDRAAGGHGPVIVERYPISGTGPGTGPRLLSLVNYEKYQDVTENRGTGLGTAGARVGHGLGTGGAQIEPVEPREPVESYCAEPVRPAPRPRPPVDSSPVVASFQCVGKGQPTYDLTEAKVAEWAQAYPSLNVVAEVRKARTWLDANPSRRKTLRGMPAFLVSWLGRANDRNPQPLRQVKTDDRNEPLLRALAEAEADHRSGRDRRPDDPGAGRALGTGGGVEGGPAEDDVAAVGTSLFAAIGAHLVPRRETRPIQDADHVEPRCGSR